MKRALEPDPQKLDLGPAQHPTPSPVCDPEPRRRWWHPKPSRAAIDALSEDDEIRGKVASLVLRAARGGQSVRLPGLAIGLDRKEDFPWNVELRLHGTSLTSEPEGWLTEIQQYPVEIDDCTVRAIMDLVGVPTPRGFVQVAALEEITGERLYREE